MCYLPKQGKIMQELKNRQCITLCIDLQCDTDQYVVVSEVGEMLAVSK
jgi:hypothetical protein